MVAGAVARQGSETLRRINLLPPYFSSVVSSSPSPVSEIRRQRARLALSSTAFASLPESKQIRCAKRFMAGTRPSNRQESRSWLHKIGDVKVSFSDEKISAAELNRLRVFIKQQDYTVDKKDFFERIDSMIQSYANLPKTIRVSYSEQLKEFTMTSLEWLQHLFANSSPGKVTRNNLQVLGYNKSTERLGIGTFHEMRLAIALQSLKSDGIIKDFLISKKYGTNDDLGIDAVIIIYEDQESSSSLSIPIQVKSFAGGLRLDTHSLAKYSLSPAEREYLESAKTEVKPHNPYAAYDFRQVKQFLRNIPTIGASGKSIKDLKLEIIKLIDETFTRDSLNSKRKTKQREKAFFQFFGNFDARSFIHKLKILMQQGFIQPKLS